MQLTDQIRDALPDGGDFGIYAHNLTTGEKIEIDADTVRPTASAAKTFILVHYAHLVAEGKLDPATRVAVKADDAVVGSGVLRYMATGLEPTFDDIAYLMIIVSDNLATNLLLRETGGPDAVNARMDGFGLPTARIHSPIKFGGDAALEFATSSPRDLGEIYTHLDDRCRSILFRQQFTDSLPRRIPHLHYAADFGIKMPVRAYNKTGSIPGICTDSGFFETDAAAWVVGAMAENLTDMFAGPENIGPSTLATIGKVLYDAWGET